MNTINPNRQYHLSQHKTSFHPPAKPPLHSRKYQPASRSERLHSWNQRMQALFTRQSY